MASTIRIKRRAAGGAAGAPASLANAEMAFNEQDNILYYGTGTGGGGGSATTVIAIGGPGWAAPLASPTFTGVPAAPTAAVDTNTTQLATTAFVIAQASSSNPVMNGSVAIGTSLRYARADHVHASDTSRAPLASPALTGTPTAPTAAVDTSTTQIATTAFVLGQAATVASPMNGVAAVGTSTTYARQDHVHASDTSRAALASPTFTGVPAAPTAATDTNTTQLATTAFVLGQVATVAPLMNGVAAVGTSLKYARQDHVHASDTSKADLASPTFTGVPVAPTAAANTNTTQLATTAFVLGQGNTTAGTITMNGTQAAGTSNLYARADHVHPSDTAKANLASPTFTGTPLSTTAAVDTNTTQIATTAFVVAQAASATPVISSGAGVVGTSLRYARGDHAHPLERLDQLAAPTASVSLNSQKITNLLDPTSAQDAATKNYVDTSIQGIRWLGARGASTATVSETSATATTLPVGGTSLVQDGVTYANNEVILLKNQTTAARNGPYTVSGVGTSILLTRIPQMDTAGEVDGKVIIIEDGTANAGTMWICVSEVTTLGTDAITWTQFNNASAYTAGNGLTLTGNDFAVVGTAGRISVASDSIDIDSAYVGQASITTLGTISTGVWSGTAVGPTKGGTGLTSFTAGDLIQSSASNTLAALAAVATGNVLISGGVGVVSSWGKVGLGTHVSGTLTVGNGGTGAVTLTGYVKGAGTSALTASSTIPNTDITGLGTMSTQSAGAVAITGGTIDGITFDGGTF